MASTTTTKKRLDNEENDRITMRAPASVQLAPLHNEPSI